MLKLLALTLLCVCTRVHALDVPPFDQNVYDPSQLMTAEQTHALLAQIQALRDQQDMQVAIALLPSLAGSTVEQAAVDFFNKWKLGEKGKDNGLLILAGINEHKIKIETGYGLEGDLPDIVCKHVIDEQIVPAFRANKFADGFSNALTALGQYRAHQLSSADIAASLTANSDSNSDAERKIDWRLFSAGFVFNMLPLIFLFAAFTYRSLQGWPVQLRQLDGWGVLGAFLVLSLLGAFFGVFYGAGAPLWLIVPFNMVFAVPLSLGILENSILILRKRKTSDDIAATWARYDAELEKFRAGVAQARLKGTEKDFLYRTPRPYMPHDSSAQWQLRHSITQEQRDIEKADRAAAVARMTWTEYLFGSGSRGSSSSSWGSSSSSSFSSSSSSSSSDSFSSSSGGGSSGGGGASGSW